MDEIEWCLILSTEGHKHCEVRRCGCPCHYKRSTGTDPKRPHSMPRATWNAMSRKDQEKLVHRLNRGEPHG